MSAAHLELLVEEPSMEAFLRALLPRILPAGRSFEVHPFQGKDDLMGKLRSRLRAYARWLPADWRIVVVVDRDDSDCAELKRRLEAIAGEAGLLTRTGAGGGQWQLVNRIAVEELESWYFGDWDAVRAAYPRVGADVVRKERFRDPDAIQGGTWEALEQVLQRYRYFETGLRKVELARALGAELNPLRCTSKSFSAFYAAVVEATA